MASQQELDDNRCDPTAELAVCRVTLIEDSRGDALLLREYLDAFSESNPGQCAFELSHYDTLQRGLEALESDGADIVLLDLGLPDCVGLASYDRIQARFPRLPIVILSGNVDVELAQQAVRKGAQDYLIKGQHNGEAMARAISHAIERHRLLEALTARSRQIEDREQQMRLLIESHSDAIFVVEPSARLLYANPASQRLLAGAARLLPGERLPFAIHLEQTSDIEIAGPGGARIVAELKSQPIDWQGKAAILCTLRDISARKRYESTLEEIARGLSSLSSGEVFSQLAGRLAHALGADQIAILRRGGSGEREIQARFGCNEAIEPVLLAPDFLSRVESGGEVLVETLDADSLAGHATDRHPATALGTRQRAGTPVLDRFGQPAGALLASWPAPAVSPHSVRPILELFAVRASNEFEREDMSSALREERGFLQDVIDAVPVPIMVIDTDYRLLLSNQAARDSRGFNNNRHDERICCYQLAHSEAAHCDGTDHPCPMREILREPRTLKLEHVHYDAAGERYFAEVFAAPFWGPDGQLRGIIHSTHDITLRRRTEEALIRRSRQLDYLAHHDTVTGLPNRTLFMDRLNRALLRAARQKSRAAVLFLDLDGFKAVNDAYGHDSGDALLHAIADRLSAALRASDTVARIGGDEFAILIEGLQHEGDAAEIAQKLVEDINPPTLIDGNAVSVGVSIGISFYPEHDRRAEGLLKKADEAMYQAKAQGRCRYHVYDPAEAEAASRQIHPGQALRQAITRGELRLFYQPQIATDGGIVCVEALVRWQHPQRGLLTPVNFFGFENDAETEILLGDWVLETACAEYARWQSQGCAPPSIAVNLFPQQLRDPGLPAKLTTLLDTYGLSGDCLEFEILELTIVEEDVLAFEQIQKLDAMGVKITIDNFGSYGSVFANLNRLPIRKIKIDRAIMDENPQRGIIIDSIVGMAHRLNMDITASGIENSRQSDVAKATPGLHVQGYHYAEPMSAQESAEFLRRRLNKN